ncbi:MAG: PQ-loop repeat-containing protein [Patulibacter sp.]|nr:PQ-loop repeat-containing protein [Patulibacter sp.]
MLLVSVLSSVAIVFGIGANLPQIARMHRSRSAAGQSPVGWIMGAVTNLCLAYVNLVGLGATLLGAANLGTVVLCSIAVALTLRFGESGHVEETAGVVGPHAVGPHSVAPAGIASIVASSHDTMVDMPTQEFTLINEAVRAAEQRRVAWREQQRAAAPSTVETDLDGPGELAFAA